MTDPIQWLIDMALAEDIGSGDITTLSIIDEKMKGFARIVAKRSLVLAGVEIAKRVFETVDSDIVWESHRHNGTRCEKGDLLATVRGDMRSLFAAERTALNFLQHLSGIATFTSLFVHAIHDTNVRILDTRKTTPGWRTLEKYAVRMGGGTNHRMGLYDSFLVKGNHIAAAGSVSAAIELVKKARQKGQPIEVETRNLKEVKEAMEGGADIIMLDNMSLTQLSEAVNLVKGSVKLEVSGNVNLENLPSYAATGIDYISVGAITHSAPAADIHMTINIETQDLRLET